MVEAGGGLLVDDADLHARTGSADTLPPLLTDPDRLAAMGAAAAALGRRDADERLADHGRAPSAGARAVEVRA